MAFASILQGDAEAVLASVNDFLKIGKEQESLEISYRFIASRKKTPWSHDYEKLMMLNIDLALRLGRPDFIPDNLLVFRNNAQAGHVSSVEAVFGHYLQRMEEHFERCAGAVAAREELFREVNEQDDAQSFYFNLLSTEEGRAKQRFRNAWRQLAAAYRTVADLSSRSPRLEDVYAKTARQALQGFADRGAHADFKAFCGLLRAHQQALTAGAPGPQTKDLANYETNRKLYELRQKQLELCRRLDFAQEAFHALEDMSALLGLSRKRGEFYVEYFQQLAAVFLRAGFHFFHAVALGRAFGHLLQLKGGESAREAEASRLVLAALAVNSQSEEFALPDALLEKYAALLGARKTLGELHAELARGALAFCPPDVQRLYRVCTGQTDLHDFSDDFTRCMGRLDPALEAYRRLVTENCVHTVLRLLARFYSNIGFAQLREFTHFVDFEQLKQLIARGRFDRQAGLFLNHEAQTLEFGHNNAGLEPALRALDAFALRLERVGGLLRRKQPAFRARQEHLTQAVGEMFRNSEALAREKEALIAKEASAAPKESTGRRRPVRKERDEEEERRRAHLKKEQERNLVVERKMLQVKKAKIKELLRLDPTLEVLRAPLAGFSEEEISQLDFSVFVELEEDLERAKTGAGNRLLEKKYKVYDFYQRALFGIYAELLAREDAANEVDLAKVRAQVAEIGEKKRLLRKVVEGAEAFIGAFKDRTFRDKERAYNDELAGYKTEVTALYKNALLAEAERTLKNRLAANQLASKGFVRGALVPGTAQPQQTGVQESVKPVGLSRNTDFRKPEEPQPLAMARRGEGLVAQKPAEPPRQLDGRSGGLGAQRPADPPRVLEGRGVKRETNEEGFKKPEESKPRVFPKLNSQPQQQPQLAQQGQAFVPDKQPKAPEKPPKPEEPKQPKAQEKPAKPEKPEEPKLSRRGFGGK